MYLIREGEPMPTIKIKCSGEMTDIDSLEEFQGELKSLTEDNYKKLRDRIIKYGFDAPLFVWKNYILDGHQRYRTIKAMTTNGHTLKNNQLPIVQIDADSIEDAKKRLLGYISQFGKIDDQGLYEFTDDIDFGEWSTEVDLPEIRLDYFKHEYMEDIEEIDYKKEWEGMPEFKNKDLSAKYSFTINFANEEDMKKFSELIEQPITLKTQSIWYPKAKQNDDGREYYINEDEE